jgi:uncharacterized protein YndB with AHSA1/START domain
VSLRLERIIRTGPEAAFDAFTDPEQLSRWFTTAAEADLRAGGRYANADGDHGTFLAFRRPQEVRFTWDNEAHCPGTVVTIRFEAPPAGEGTSVILEHARLADAEEVLDMRVGWEWALDCLKSYLETGTTIPFETWKEANRSRFVGDG